jgi:choline dehydrogenase-like flavoprotein
LKTVLIHPLVEIVPASLGGALALFRNLHAALGLVNINFPDERRDGNRLGLESTGQGEETRLVIDYAPGAGEPERLRATAATFRKLLRRLGCIAPRLMTRVRPMGASVHYAGSVPMCTEGGSRTATPTCRSRDFENLWFVDGTTFPSLPAKNLTFTLMANAARVAELDF